MSGGVGIVRTGAAARSGRRRLDCAGPGWHPLGASASAADVGRGSRSDGPSPRPGREPVVGHALDRAARHRRPARPHRPPAGSDGAPVLCTVVCRFDAAAEGRAAAGRFDVADSYAPAGGRPVGPAAGRATRPGGRRLDPLQGKTPRARAEARASGRGHPDRGGRSHDRVG
jgi:hypothetical protein